MIKGAKEKGLNALILKNIAIIAMIIDHVTWAFLRPYTGNSFYILAWYEILRGIGRLTMPIMCLLLVEGFFYTRNLKKYFVRLFLFALISHVPYVFFNFGVWGIKLFPVVEFQTSVIFNLFLSLLFITIAKKQNINTFIKLFFYFLLFFMSLFCDWGSFPIFASIIFLLFRSRPVWKITVYSICLPVWFYVHFFLKMFINLLDNGIVFAFHNTHITVLSQMENTWQYRLFFIGLFAAIPFIAMYNGKKGGTEKSRLFSFLSKWFFYIFYPVHLIVLGIWKYGNIIW